MVKLQTVIVIVAVAILAVHCFAASLEKPHESLPGKSLKRVKRNLLQFSSMIECATGKSWSNYDGYGCYCGWGGKGRAVDSLDRCCQRHDQCYDNIGGWTCFPKSETYDRVGLRCADSNDDCESKVCACDAEAAMCFARSTWNPDYEDWPQSKC